MTMKTSPVKVKKKRHARFPWAEWFEKKRFTLTSGRDFTCKIHGMYQMVKNNAARYGKLVDIVIKNDEIRVKITGSSWGE